MGEGQTDVSAQDDRGDGQHLRRRRGHEQPVGQDLDHDGRQREQRQHSLWSRGFRPYLKFCIAQVFPLVPVEKPQAARVYLVLDMLM